MRHDRIFFLVNKHESHKKIHEENIQIVKVSLIIELDIKVTYPSAIPRKIKKANFD